MSIKLVALDMDGTLMAPDHLTVTDRTRRAIAAAHEKGTEFTIATGRTMAIIGDVCEQVPQINYIIHSNGAAVFDRRQNKFIYTNLMEWSFAEKIVDFLEANTVFYEIYVDGKSYANPDKAQYFVSDFLPKEFLDELAERMEIHRDIKKHIAGKDVEKITFYCPDDETFHEMWSRFSRIDGIDLASSLPGTMEMTKKGVTKGVALENLCKIVGASPAETMSFGDAGNDCPMLEYADYSFAMENGTDECKASAKYIAPSNAENGVAQMIEKYILK